MLEAIYFFSKYNVFIEIFSKIHKRIYSVLLQKKKGQYIFDPNFELEKTDHKNLVFFIKNEAKMFINSAVKRG